jgi:hypothetical protein
LNKKRLTLIEFGEISPTYPTTAMKIWTLFSIATLGIAGAGFGQYATDPVGFTNLAAPAGTSLVVPTMLEGWTFRGQATISGDGLTVTPVLTTNWTVGQFAGTSFTAPQPNFPRYYVEIASGVQEGLIVDINNNTGTNISVHAGDFPPALRGTTVEIMVRKHLTLDKAFQGAVGLSAYQDSVSVFNSDGSQSLCNFDGSSFVDGSFVNGVGHTVIYPGTGFVFSAAEPVTFTFMGSVKTTKTKVPLYAGVTNIVGPLNPSSATLLNSGGSLAAALEPYQDGINNFSTNGQMAILGAYSSDGSAILDGSFSPLAPNATDAIPLNRGVVVSVVNDTVWTVDSPIPPPAP